MLNRRPFPGAGSVNLAELLSAFAFAADLAFGLELEDGLRSTYIADRIAERMGLAPEDRLTVYYTALLKDAGCTCWTSPLAEFWRTNEIDARRDLMIFGGAAGLSAYSSWMRRYVGSDLPFAARVGRSLQVFAASDPMMSEGFASAAEVCARISKRLGLPEPVQQASANLLEQWNGKGAPNGISGEDIPIASRVILPTYVLAPVHRAAGRDAACDVARRARGEAFAPDVADAFLDLAAEESFWETLEGPDLQTVVYDSEPVTELANASDARMDDIAYAFADFIDLKSHYAAAHSRRVARIAEQIGALMGCTAEQHTLLLRGSLMHDLGLVAVPSLILNKPEASLTRSEEEALRLHPYHGERILARVSAMAPLMPLIGGHHERMDGNGYFRGLRARELPMESRIIAVANRLDELTHDAPGHSGLDVTSALRVLGEESGDGLDGEVVDALKTCLGAGAEKPLHKEWPAGLSDREVEVLRLAARGLKRREIGKQLSISENTVRHHLEHIYAKTDTSTRVGATLFAMENDLFD